MQNSLSDLILTAGSGLSRSDQITLGTSISFGVLGVFFAAMAVIKCKWNGFNSAFVCCVWIIIVTNSSSRRMPPNFVKGERCRTITNEIQRWVEDRRDASFVGVRNIMPRMSQE